MRIIQESGGVDWDRAAGFAELARRRAAGELLVPPTMLPDEDRRQHVRATLREDHRFRIQDRPAGAQAKFDKLAKSAWNFFRGTGLLFYRDLAGSDADLPFVLVNGDAHPENFGVMPNEDGAPFFGLNDFDEATFAPFSWELKRAALGFYLCARCLGRKKKKCRKTVRSFLDGYFDGLLEFAQNDREKSHQFRIDNSPPMIRELLQAACSGRRDFLADMIDLQKGSFRSTKKIVPHTSQIDKFQSIVDDYRQSNKVPETRRAGHFQVKDVAIKKGSGTASLGLDRYLVLIDGETDDHADDVVLEMKQTRPSAMTGLVPGVPKVDQKDRSDGESSQQKQGPQQDPDAQQRSDAQTNLAQRIVTSHQVHLVGGDPYYGTAMVDGRSFLVRERSPFKDDIDVDELSHGELQEYANICGRTVAIAHARCDEDMGLMVHSDLVNDLDGMHQDAEKAILASVHRRLFSEDLVRFARTAAQRLEQDYRAFQNDHACGAFSFIAQDD